LDGGRGNPPAAYVMKKSLLVLSIFCFLLVCGFGSSARADEYSPEKTTEKKAKEQPPPEADPLKEVKIKAGEVEKKEEKAEKKEEKAEKKEEKAEKKENKTENQSAAKTPFVDRDGDGIQDGKEHRFRGRHRGRHKKAGSKAQGSQGKRQIEILRARSQPGSR
jgi:hypothetical protein